MKPSPTPASRSTRRIRNSRVSGSSAKSSKRSTPDSKSSSVKRAWSGAMHPRRSASSRARLYIRQSVCGGRCTSRSVPCSRSGERAKLQNRRPWLPPPPLRLSTRPTSRCKRPLRWRKRSLSTQANGTTPSGKSRPKRPRPQSTARRPRKSWRRRLTLSGRMPGSRTSSSTSKPRASPSNGQRQTSTSRAGPSSLNSRESAAMSTRRSLTKNGQPRSWRSRSRRNTLCTSRDARNSREPGRLSSTASTSTGRPWFRP
mmetsp:Transcript_15119/g.44731  ORF Transcript_15119/g.44731 Transcript_15119/m.44731 type:complete len:257 (+) Transcript_15119:726-1496(+)